MKNWKKVVTFIIAAILALLIMGYAVINIVSSTIMSKSYILSKFQSTKYYSKLYELVESNFEKYTQQSGLEEDVVKGLVTEEKIEKDTKQILSNLFDGIHEEISTKELEDNLRVNINKSIHGRKLSSDEEKAVNTFIGKISDEYKSTIINTKYEKTINTYYLKLVDYLNLANKALLISIAIILVILFIMNIKRIYLSINGIGTALLSSGCVLAIANIFINLKVNINSITFMNNVFSEALRKVLNDMISKIGIYGWFLVLSGLTLIILSNLVHNIRKYGTKKKYKKGDHSNSDTEFTDDYE